LRAGYIVLADRYVYTAYAMDIVRSSSPTWVRKVYDFAIKPDATFYFRVPNDIAIERISVGRPKHRSFGNTFIFDPEELVRVGKAYNLTTKIQTKVLNVKEEYRKVFEDNRKTVKSLHTVVAAAIESQNQANSPTLQKILLYAAAAVKKIKRGRY
jgi:thymidylate kinase